MTKLRIDMLGFTFPVPMDRRDSVRESLNEWSSPKGRSLSWQGSTYRYGNAHQEKLTGAKIEIYPRCKAHNFLRLEFNPNRDDVKHPTRKVVQLLTETVGDDVLQLIHLDSRVTRIDLCLTINEPLPECFIYLKGARQSELIFGNDDQLESQIAGVGRMRITLYDKSRQQASTAEPKARLEVRVRDIGVPLCDLDDKIAEEFRKISFYDKALLEDETLSKDFQQDCSEHGLNSAMARLMANTGDRNLKRRYETVLRRYRVDPFGLDNSELKVNWKPIQPLLATESQ